MSAAPHHPSVQRALEAAVELGEQGVQVAAYHDSELIVDQWIGAADAGGSPVTEQTIFPIFSVTKAVTATALHVQAERGLVDYDEPIATYWPEYAQHGKGNIRVRDVLSHRGGVPQLPAEIDEHTLVDWAAVTTALAAVEPLFAPDTVNSYHSLSFGWLIGEVVRRTDPAQRSFADFVQQEICQPLKISSLYLGTPAEVRARVATLTFPGQPAPTSPDALATQAMPNPLRLAPPLYNEVWIQEGVIPAVGAVADAASVARFFALIANGGELDGVRLLSEDRVRSFLTPRADFDGHDVTYGRQMPVGTSGFWLTAPGVTPPEAIDWPILAHPGAGGSIGWAELDNRLSVAVCHNRMFAGTDPFPFGALGEAIREVAFG